MKRKRFKISYIRKPYARGSLRSLLLAAAALVLCMISVGLSVHRQGQGELNVAAWGFSSLVFAITAMVNGIPSFYEKEANYLLVKISTAISGFLIAFWIMMILIGLFS